MILFPIHITNGHKVLYFIHEVHTVCPRRSTFAKLICKNWRRMIFTKHAKLISWHAYHFSTLYHLFLSFVRTYNCVPHRLTSCSCEPSFFPYNMIKPIFARNIYFRRKLNNTVLNYSPRAHVRLLYHALLLDSSLSSLEPATSHEV